MARYTRQLKRADLPKKGASINSLHIPVITKKGIKKYVCDIHFADNTLCYLEGAKGKTTKIKSLQFILPEKPLTMRAYQAYNSKITLAFDCTQISDEQWDKIMIQSIKANGRKIKKMIREQIPKLYEQLELYYPNPYETDSRRTNEYLIYTHSTIEYFLKIT